MSADTAAITLAIESDERRARRDSYRNAGGSKRRPLKSFMTAKEKREARDAHAALLKLAVDELREPTGFERWLETLELNPSLTPMNAALVALQTPGEIVGTLAQWRRQGYNVRKGEHAAGRITARGFWPLAYFTAEQVNAGDLIGFEPELPDAAEADGLRCELIGRLDAGERSRLALEAVAEMRTPAPLSLAA